MYELQRGNDLNNLRRLQNVITGIVLSQKGAFSNEDIYVQVDKWCEGSPYAVDGAKRGEVDIKAMVDETLNTLWGVNCLCFADAEQKKVKLNATFPVASIEV